MLRLLLTIGFLLGAAAVEEPLAFATVGADGSSFGAGGVTGGGKKAARRAVKETVRDAIAQVAGDGPILAPGVYLQYPEQVEPRSIALAVRRRAVLLTDGAIYQRKSSGLFGGIFETKERPVPYAYIIDGATGVSTFNLQFKGRRALPYGIAEDPRDGRIVVTFYQSQVDSVEVWQPDLSWKLTYHDVSLKPSIPFFFGPSGELWIPFTLADRFLEESDRALQLYIYRKDGQREETFPRREWSRIRYPHTVRVDAAGRVWAAGLHTWAWEDGVYGPVPKSLNSSQTPATIFEVYGLTSDRSNRGSPFVKEQRERWLEQNPGVEPSPQQRESTNTRYALLPMASFPFPDTCQWPLFDLTGDGRVIAACYGSNTLVVYAAYRKVKKAPAEGGAEAPPPELELRESMKEEARFVAPLGIQDIGAIVMDPSGKSFTLLDRSRKRVYSAAWPLDREALGGDGRAGAHGVTERPVTGISWHV